jgi:lipoic acid synthetase
MVRAGIWGAGMSGDGRLGADAVAAPDITTARVTSGRRPKPPWLRVRAPGGDKYAHLKRVLRKRGLYTVCEEARCPNVGECWGGGTATFMVLGDVFTRGCRFCAVTSGNPGGKVDAEEPANVAGAVHAMGPDYVVVTMVNRDDLPDQGAAHVAECIRAIRRRAPDVLVEALVGDFSGRLDLVDLVCDAGPDVLAHNVETVESMQALVRDQRAEFEQSLAVLERAKAHRLAPYTKSSMMLGLGERDDEVIAAMSALRRCGVDFLTLGQYLQPTPGHLPVRYFVTPEMFDAYRRKAEAIGFRYVASGPLVRSSYRAGELFIGTVIRSAGALSV